MFDVDDAVRTATTVRGWTTVSVLALLTAAGGPALAQSAGTAAPATSAIELEEIVVTAQRRQERLVDVPISVTSISADTLSGSGVTSVIDLPQTAPGLRFDYSGSFVQPTIRGVGSPLVGPGLNSNVAVYLDGFYVPNALGTDFQLLSVANVEVLKGPQGTLFGRNATGGAVLVRTREPSFTPTMVARASYASFDRTNLSFYGSSGLTDKLAVDLTGYYEQGDGYVKNLNTGRKDGQFDKWAVRGKLLYTPTDSSSFTLTYGHSEVDDPTPVVTSSYDGLSAGSVVPGTLVADGPRETTNGLEAFNRFKGDSVFLRADFDLGFADLKSYTQYRDERSRQFQDYDGTAVPIFAPDYRILDKTVTQELNLSSADQGPLSWVLGLYYYHNVNEFPGFNVSLGGAPYAKFFNSKTVADSYAAFADVTYELVDGLFLTGGLRYGLDELDGSFDASGVGGRIDGAQKKFASFTPRAILRYQFDDSSNVYLSFNRGYKAGVIPVASFSTVPVSPEHISAYELGYKTAQGPLRFEASAFYYDYTNLQVAAYVGVTSIIRNAASSRIYGADAQLTARVADGLDLTAGLVYTHAEYRAFPGAIAYRQDLTPGSPSFSLFNTPSVDAGGNVMPRSPKMTANIGATYTTELAGGALGLNANFYYTSKFYFDSVEQFGQDGYGLLNLRASWTTPSDAWEFAVYGNNVTDTKYRNQVLPGTFAIQQTYGEPASIGVSATYRY